MRILRVVAEGITTSFRYPHFIQQVQPTFELPPPTTIYGHIASALGDWFDPGGVKFAYHFTFAKKQRDIEHTIILSPKGGKLYPGSQHPKNLVGTVNPFEREILFWPKLTLYLNQPDWLSAFQSPHYAVVLGRSQDLFTYTDISLIDLEQAERAYFEHTLLPYSTNQRTMRGYAVTMPRFLDYHSKRFPTSAQYFVVQERVHTENFLWFGVKPEGVRYWTDPTSPAQKGAHLGLAWHSFTGEGDAPFTLAGSSGN